VRAASLWRGQATLRLLPLPTTDGLARETPCVIVCATADVSSYGQKPDLVLQHMAACMTEYACPAGTLCPRPGRPRYTELSLGPLAQRQARRLLATSRVSAHSVSAGEVR
jgi:hypothetical protein